LGPPGKIKQDLLEHALVLPTVVWCLDQGGVLAGRRKNNASTYWTGIHNWT
jgi:hypothetical protein